MIKYNVMIMRSRIAAGIFLVFLLGAGAAGISSARAADAPRKVLLFFSPSCSHCVQVKQELIPRMQKEFGGAIEFGYHDITDVEQYKMLLALRETYSSDVPLNVPIIFLDGMFLGGQDAINGNLRTLIAASLAREAPGHTANLSTIDLFARFKNFRPLTVAAAGLADGINPCAFTVIVFFISFLAVQGYRRRELVVIGLAFICAVFLTYLVIGLGLFNFLYRFRGFWAVTKTLNAVVGLLSCALGIFSLYDFFKYRSTGAAEGLLLQLPQAVKRRIHGVIGYFYRNPRRAQTSARPAVVRLVISALATGFLVSLLEAVCTGQLYLPTIIFVLKSNEHRVQALQYLLMYNLMFIVPLLAVFSLSLAGTTSGQFAAFMRRHLGLTKIILAAVFLGMGIFLLWRL